MNVRFVLDEVLEVEAVVDVYVESCYDYLLGSCDALRVAVNNVKDLVINGRYVDFLRLNLENQQRIINEIKWIVSDINAYELAGCRNV